MVVCIANKHAGWTAVHTGKGKFVQRLIPELEKLGVRVTTNPADKCDVALHIGHIRYSSRARVDILRIGAVRVSTHENYRRLNAQRRKSVKLAQGVIYQSRYSRKTCHKFVCKPDCPEVVIFNGARLSDYHVYQPNSNKRILLASTRKWITQKRLKDVCAAFLGLSRDDVELQVVGNTLGQEAKWCKEKGIRFLGMLSDQKLAGLLSKSEALVHVVYLDACPNSVVEGLCAGLRVVTTDQGGTKELVGAEDIVLSDYPFKYEPINLNKPPKLNRIALTEAMENVLGMSHTRADIDAVRRRLSIDVIARDYLGFFQEVLSNE